MYGITPPRNLTPGLCKTIGAESLQACAEVAARQGRTIRASTTFRMLFSKATVLDGVECARLRVEHLSKLFFGVGVDVMLR